MGARMLCLQRIVPMVAALMLASGAFADVIKRETGSDTFIAGPVIDEALNTAGDAFVSSRSLDLQGQTKGDLHITGFNVDVNADVAEDLYAFGATVSIRGNTAGDLTVAGFSVRTDAVAATGANARLLGSTVTIDGPVSGALSAIGRDVILNAQIDGDARIVAKSITFGPKAVISGTLIYSAATKLTVPETVAPAERVVFERMASPDVWDDWGEVGREMPVFPTFATMFFGFVVSLVFFLILGALMLSFLPDRLEKLRQSVAEAPGRSILLGVLGLSMLFGLVPVTGLTIVGLPFVPIVILTIIIFWTLGYALGAYSVAMRLWTGLGGEDNPSNVVRLLVFGAAIVIVALLNFIPFLGWVANYTIVLMGVGAMTRIFCNSIYGTGSLQTDPA